MARASTPTLRTMSTISNMKATILLAVIIATAALIWPVIRRQSPERQLELAIENLASPDFDKTKDAEKRILEVGPSAVPALATSIRNSRDQDQRRLLYALIRELDAVKYADLVSSVLTNGTDNICIALRPTRGYLNSLTPDRADALSSLLRSIALKATDDQTRRCIEEWFERCKK